MSTANKVKTKIEELNKLYMQQIDVVMSVVGDCVDEYQKANPCDEVSLSFDRELIWFINGERLSIDTYLSDTEDYFNDDLPFEEFNCHHGPSLKVEYFDSGRLLTNLLSNDEDEKREYFDLVNSLRPIIKAQAFIGKAVDELNMDSEMSLTENKEWPSLESIHALNR